jgi:hypothetical protein
MLKNVYSVEYKIYINAVITAHLTFMTGHREPYLVNIHVATKKISDFEFHALSVRPSAAVQNTLLKFFSLP